MEKQFLDLAGLKVYDELIKELITNNKQDVTSSLNALTTLVNNNKTSSDASDAALQALINANSSAIGVLNGDKTVEGSVKQQVQTAVDSIVGGASEALDTLKEIEEWIKGDESGTAALVTRVATNENNIEDLFSKVQKLTEKDAEIKTYIDNKNKDLWNSIGSIEHLSINALFLDEVNLSSGQTIANAIANLNTTTQKLVLTNETINTEDLTVPAGVVIEANGASFFGNLTVSKDAVISDAIFAGKVTIE